MGFDTVYEKVIRFLVVVLLSAGVLAPLGQEAYGQSSAAETPSENTSSDTTEKAAPPSAIASSGVIGSGASATQVSSTELPAEEMNAALKVGIHSGIRLVEMNMPLFAGASTYFSEEISQAEREQNALVVVLLDTPGGSLQAAQEIVQTIFASTVPVAIYVSPSGGGATSAGVFITTAGHVAAMAPGTTIGAAKPIMGTGENLPDDLKTKVENTTASMVKAISEQRGRNAEWVVKSVTESASLTETEAKSLGVVDLVARSVDEVIAHCAGKTFDTPRGRVRLPEDLAGSPRELRTIGWRHQILNVVASPEVAALLWLGATAGISVELYNPGALVPGIVGVLCLILALMVSQVVPLNQGALALVMLSGLLFGAELFVGSGVLTAGGIVALLLGLTYLVDVSQAPGMSLDFGSIVTLAVVGGGAMAFVVYRIARDIGGAPVTGEEGMVGMIAEVKQPIAPRGQVFVNGEYWSARLAPGVTELLETGRSVEIVEVDGLTLYVKPSE